MKTLISQDGLKAIAADKIDFFVIPEDRNQRKNFTLLAKTPKSDNGFYEFLIMFEHEDIEVVKQVMRFLTVFTTSQNDFDIVNVDLKDLYERGMKKIFVDTIND